MTRTKHDRTPYDKVYDALLDFRARHCWDADLPHGQRLEYWLSPDGMRPLILYVQPGGGIECFGQLNDTNRLDAEIAALRKWATNPISGELE